eukprot:CAMPEP_0182426534 /NCGR_PEP_ID=MMETSP1167-20130531/13026_1 /TAXON_ID=2988 /ORGANISM="Mallomonas Sp, Strain CCMP3275" /LENGTH=430 /DNA_ID=CAMNT_0024608023 /DNA_START=117 /DNA_END=1409 /DNA_ORIENTATION=-
MIIKRITSENELVISVNNLLNFAGLGTKIKSFNELKKVSSSLFVALFEAFFFCELHNVCRNPLNKEDYILNAQLVVDSISQRINVNLHHISGEDIVQGDFRSLSNLANIFLRIVNLTQSPHLQPNEPLPGTTLQREQDTSFSVSSAGSIDEEEEGRRSSLSSVPVLSDSGSGSGLVSRSTRSREKERDGHNRRAPGHSRARVPTSFDCLRMTPEDVRMLVEMEAREAVLRSQSESMFNEKQEAARSRRQHLVRSIATRSAVRNSKKDAVALKAKQRKWLEELESEERSFQLARSHCDSVTLRKCYAGYLHRLKSWRLEEQKEVAARIKELRQQSHLHIQSLTNLFEDRVRMLGEGSSHGHRLGGGKEALKKSRRVVREMSNSFSEGQKRMLEIRREEVRQDRSKLMLQREEAHRCLLQLLSEEDWRDSLR